MADSKQAVHLNPPLRGEEEIADPLRGVTVVVMEEEDEAEEVMEVGEDEAEEAMVEAMIEEAEEGDEAEVEVEDNKIQGNQFTIFWSKLRFWDSHFNKYKLLTLADGSYVNQYTLSTAVGGKMMVEVEVDTVVEEGDMGVRVLFVWY